MPNGVEVIIEDGVATVVFTDDTLRIRGVGDLLHASGSDPHQVVKITHPRTAYIVPEDVARAAGLVDETDMPAVPAPPVHGYDDGKPDMDWSRAAINEYAAGLGLDPKQYPNKESALAAIRAAEG